MTATTDAHHARADVYRAEGGKLRRIVDPSLPCPYYEATSTSKPGWTHVVMLTGCSCKGFVHHGHCKHHSALVVALLKQEGIASPQAA